MTTFRVKVNNRWYTVEVGDLSSSPMEVYVDGEPLQVEVEVPEESGGRPRQRLRPRSTAGITASATETTVVAPMPGRIVRVSVTEGQTVEAGDEVCVLETMKMEQSIRTARAGVVRAVKVAAGKSVAAGEVLVELE